MLKVSRFWSSFLFAVVVWVVALLCWWMVPLPPVPEAALARFTDWGRHFYRPDYDMPIYLAAGLLSVLGCAIVLRSYFVANPEAAASGSISEHPGSVNVRIRRRFDWCDITAVIIICSFVLVIDPDKLMERAFSIDGFHHVDFYLMGPLQAVLSGKILGSEVYSQYGGGWVLVYVLISQFCQVDHKLFFATFAFFGTIYFAVAYFALRSLIRDRWWALIGLLAGILLVIYSGVGIPRWVTPSSTVLRCPFDMLAAIAILKLLRHHNFWWALIAGSAGGASLLFGVDTGIYISGGLVVVSVLMTLQMLCGGREPIFGKLLLIWCAWCVSLLLGLSLASRGTLNDPRFWSGYFDAILTYGGGFSALPMTEIIAKQPFVTFAFFVVLIVYSFSLSLSIARASVGKADAEDMMRAFLATVGFGTLMIFVNRSNEYNLCYTLLPACWLLTGVFADRYPLDRCEVPATPRTSRRMAAVLTIGILSALLLNRIVRDYPSVVGRSIAWIRKYPIDPPAVPNLINAIRKVGTDIRDRSPDEPLVVVGEDPILWLLTLKLPPVGRFCPAMPITLSQSEQVRRDLLATGAKRIVVARVPRFHEELGKSTLVEQIVSVDFELQEATELYATYVRRAEESTKGPTLEKRIEE